MQLQGEKPIFLQLAEQLEDGILSGAYPEGSQVPSITEYAATYKINPATALKGINLLVNAGLLYKNGALACLWPREPEKTCAGSVLSVFTTIM